MKEDKELPAIEELVSLPFAQNWDITDRTICKVTDTSIKSEIQR